MIKFSWDTFRLCCYKLLLLQITVLISIYYLHVVFSSPDHEVVMVRYSDGAMSGVRRRALCVVRRQQLGC
jgi:hypothetical protein